MNERDFPFPRCPLDCGVRPQGAAQERSSFRSPFRWPLRDPPGSDSPDADRARSAVGVDAITPLNALSVKVSGRSRRVADPAAPPPTLARLRDAPRLRHDVLRTEQACADRALRRCSSVDRGAASNRPYARLSPRARCGAWARSRCLAIRAASSSGTSGLAR